MPKRTTHYSRSVRALPCGLIVGLMLQGVAVSNVDVRAASPSDPVFPRSDPAHEGLSPAALRAIDSLLQSYVERDLVVGCTFAVIKNHRTVMHETYGWRDRERSLPIEQRTLFNIRSMTKMVTGAAAQILIDDGRLALNDKVVDYLPGFDRRLSRDITIEQLLTHRSGLPLSILTSLDEYPDLQSMANAIGNHGPQFRPGVKFWYSDAGTDTLGAVIEVAADQKLDRFVRSRLLDPLEMADTYYLTEETTPRDRIASLYFGAIGSWTRIWTSAQPFYPFAWGSQSLYSTPTDYAKFLALLLDNGVANGKRILSEAAVARILEPVSVMTSLGSDVPAPTGFPGLESHYGQMAVLYTSPDGVNAFGHSGSDGTWAWAWPREDLMILYFTQSRGQATGIRLETEMARLLLNPGITTSPEVVERYAAYCGDYRADFDSALGTFRDEHFSIVIQNDRLGLDVPGQFIFELRDASPNGRWYFDLASNLSVAFNRDEAGAVSGIRFYEPGHVFSLDRSQACPSAAAPVFLGPGIHTDGNSSRAFQAMLMGRPNCRYGVEFSTDLRTWKPLRSLSSPDGQMEIRDGGMDNNTRMFYRARVAPR